MITGRFATPGKTRTCPHCRATILDSATVCPGCHHHLRFDSSGASARVQPSSTPLRVEGTLRHPANGGSWEYSVVLAIRNDRGEEIARQVVGVGALQPGDARTFSLAVEVFKPAEIKEPKPQAADAAQRTAADSKGPEVRVPGRPGLPPPPRPATPAPPTPAQRPAMPLADSKPGTARPAGTASPAASPAAPGRVLPGQPLRPPQPPGLNGGSAVPNRGPAPAVRPKRP